MYNKNKEILMELIGDMDFFAKMKNIKYPPIYLLGGSGCIIAGYLDRATTDIDLLDMGYGASMGRLFRILDRFDMLDIYLTTIPLDFRKRVIKLEDFENIYILSREDIILSKIGRYSEKDVEDISILLIDADKNLVHKLIEEVTLRKNISERVKEAFMINARLFKERFYV